MTQYSIPGLHPAPTRHARLVAWVEQMAALTRPALLGVGWVAGVGAMLGVWGAKVLVQGILAHVAHRRFRHQRAGGAAGKMTLLVL